jgi:hypothetical protein
MEQATKPTTNLKAMSIKDFAKSKGFMQLAPAVRINTNGYPFITFINEKNEAENIYFSKSAAEQVAEGTPVDKALLSRHQIGITTNAEGEERIKLISNSERVDLFSLLD